MPARIFLLIVWSASFPLWAAVETPEKKPTLPATEQLTTSGQSRQPVVAGTKSLLYVSRGRRSHKDPQIYLRDQETGKEKRITFQRGQIINGLWMASDDKIIYASSTDEEKETPQLLKDFLQRFPAQIDTHFFFHLHFPPTELYMSDLLGRTRERLSHSIGFDAFPAYIEKSQDLYFSRLSNDHIGLYKTNLKKNKKGKANKVIKVLQTLGHDLGLQASPSQEKMVWYRFSPDFSSSQLMLADAKLSQPQFLTMDDGIQWAPSWHPNEKSILYSAKKKTDRDYELYEISTNGSCQRKLASLPGDDFFPVMSPDEKSIYFTSTTSGNEQIHKIAYPGPLTCEVASK